MSGTEQPEPPCRPGCKRCAKVLRVLGAVGYNNWRSFGEVHPAEERGSRVRRRLPESLKRAFRRWLLQAIVDPGRALRARDDSGIELEVAADGADPGPTFVEFQLVVDDGAGPNITPELADVAIAVGAAIDAGALRGATVDQLLEVLAVVGLYVVAAGEAPGELVQRLARREMGPSFTCPRCGRTSHNPHDLSEGYCGACHDWTGVCGHCGAAACDCGERAACGRHGEPGHYLCGCCPTCGEPRFKLCEHTRRALLPAAPRSPS